MICSTRYRLKHNKTENQNYIGSFPFILNVLLWKRCFFENDLLLKGKKDFAESRRDESSVSKAKKRENCYVATVYLQPPSHPFPQKYLW